MVQRCPLGPCPVARSPTNSLKLFGTFEQHFVKVLPKQYAHPHPLVLLSTTIRWARANFCFSKSPLTPLLSETIIDLQHTKCQHFILSIRLQFPLCSLVLGSPGSVRPFQPPLFPAEKVYLNGPSHVFQFHSDCSSSLMKTTPESVSFWFFFLHRILHIWYVDMALGPHSDKYTRCGRKR